MERLFTDVKHKAFCLILAVLGTACVHGDWTEAETIATRCPEFQEFADSIPTEGPLTTKHLLKSFSFTQKHKTCDEGIYSSVHSDIVTRAVTYDSANALAAMDGDKGLGDFALRHVDASADLSDLEKGRANIRAACLKKKYKACDAVESEFNEAIRVGSEP